MNVLVDTMAKQTLTEALENEAYLSYRTETLPHDRCPISFCSDDRTPQNFIQANLAQTIKIKAGRIRVRRYWKHKRKFTENNEHTIDWKVVHRSHLALDKGKKKWLNKWMTGFCGVGKMMKVYGFQTHSKCPKCQQSNETTDHVMQCTSYGTHTLWRKSMRSLSSWILENDGPTEFAEVIIANLSAWKHQSTFPPVPAQRWLREAVLSQDDIGWRSFLDGFISYKWRKAIEKHFEEINSKKSAALWTSRLVRQIWEIQWLMWMDRNNTLHGEGNTIHLEEITAINEELLIQWRTGIDDLPPARYQHLFQGDFRTLYQTHHNQKKQWLTSVWLAREQHAPLPIQRNAIAENFYQRWHRRINDTNTTDIAITSENPAQESPHTTEPPSATLPCEVPPELDPPPAEPPD
jgi:hypothetical protein